MVKNILATETWQCSEPIGWVICFMNQSGQYPIFQLIHWGLLPWLPAKIAIFEYLAQFTPKNMDNFCSQGYQEQCLMLNIFIKIKKLKMSVVHPPD